MAARIRIVGLVVSLVAASGVVWVQTRPDPPPRFCTADGVIDEDGTTYGRDPDQGCAFVDEDGRPLVVERDEDGAIISIHPR